MSILDEAARVVDGPRQDEYGHPIDNHGCTGHMFGTWSRRLAQSLRNPDRAPGFDALSKEQLEGIQVCTFNIIQKLSRLANDPTKVDSLVDIAGYARNWEMILQEELDEDPANPAG